jgi:endoglycosylceramidase
MKPVRLALALSFCAVLAQGACAAAPLTPLSQQGRWLTDTQGRVVIVHGGNMIQLAGDSQGDFANAKDGQWHNDTPGLTAAAGFNGIRLAIFLSRLAPTPDRIDTAYLDAVAETVAAYRRAGVRVLIDLHQDEFGPEVGVRGMPGWMTLTGGLKRDPSLHFPNGYFRDPAVKAAFDNFWADGKLPDGRTVQQAYIDALVAVARRFADEPGLIGIDLMNEPATGTPCSQPDPTSANCPELEQRLLAPFYARAGKAVAAVDPKLVLFVEPFMLQGALGIPIQTPMPGTRFKGLSFHNYGPFRPTREKVSEAALARATATGAAILNTEWGFSNDAGDLAGQAQDFDSRLIPWLAWARGPFEGLVNPAATHEAAINRDAVLRAYARPYPSATAGTPIALSFDANSGTFDYRWSTQGPDGRDRTRLTTEIRMPAPSFPQGYRVTVTGGRIISTAGAPLLIVKAAAPGTVLVHAERIGTLPSLDTPKIAPPSGFSLDSLVGDLMKDPRSKAVLDRYLPTLTASKEIGLASQASLRSMQPYLPEMSQEIARKVDAALKAIPPR